MQTQFNTCQCGCGAFLPLLGTTGKPLRFLQGHNARINIEAFFLERIRVGEPPQHCPELRPCWNWTGDTITGGYGQINRRRVHRIAWDLAYGPIPEGLFVLHKCDNRLCVRPAHLFLGTHKDNSDDKICKGRGRHPGMQGEKHPKAKVREQDVRDIRMLALGGTSQYEIARRFNLTQAAISLIVKRRNWAHVL